MLIKQLIPVCRFIPAGHCQFFDCPRLRAAKLLLLLIKCHGFGSVDAGNPGFLDGG